MRFYKWILSPYDAISIIAFIAFSLALILPYIWICFIFLLLWFVFANLMCSTLLYIYGMAVAATAASSIYTLFEHSNYSIRFTERSLCRNAIMIFMVFKVTTMSVTVSVWITNVKRNKLNRVRAHKQRHTHTHRIDMQSDYIANFYCSFFFPSAKNHTIIFLSFIRWICFFLRCSSNDLFYISFRSVFAIVQSKLIQFNHTQRRGKCKMWNITYLRILLPFKGIEKQNSISLLSNCADAINYLVFYYYYLCIQMRILSKVMFW